MISKDMYSSEFKIVSYFNDLIRNTNTTMQSNLPSIDDQRLIYNISRKYLSKQEKPLSRPKD
ncbi:Gpi15 [Saccharomyces cerevisiae]|nr:Gpi15 [Saccharomyces cerevisiae]